MDHVLNKRWISLVLLRMLFLLAALSLNAHKAPCQDDVGANEIELWVSQLADANPEVRMEAQAKLLGAEDKSLAAVRAGSLSSDIEVSSSCKILVEKIEIRRVQRLRKLFLSDNYKAVRPDTLPAWSAFRDFDGQEDVAARKLFLKMCDELKSVFKDYEILVETSPASLKKMARLLLAKENKQDASTVSRTVGFLFLSDLAVKSLSEQEPGDLFSNVETLEALQFLSNYSNSSVIRKSDYRILIERQVARWVAYWESVGRVSAEAKLKMVYQTSNLELMESLNENYESLDVDGRLRYIDIAYRAAANSECKNESWIQCSKLLEKPLSDETIAVHSRVRKEPASKVTVTVRMLAEGVLAKAIKRSAGMGNPIEVDPIFGSFPFSRSAFAIIREEKDRELMSRYLQDSQSLR